MARVTIEDCLKKVNNRFTLVHLGAKRVIQLRKGASPLVDAPKNKEVVVALREIAAGLVDFDSIGQIEPDELAAADALPQQSLEEGESEFTTQETTEETSLQPTESDETEEVDEE